MTTAVPGSAVTVRSGVTITQFLGSFNDNLFKQLVLLICLDYKQSGESDFQPIAMGLFAVPFVAFSGFAGWCTAAQPVRVQCRW